MSPLASYSWSLRCGDTSGVARYFWCCNISYSCSAAPEDTKEDRSFDKQSNWSFVDFKNGWINSIRHCLCLLLVYLFFISYLASDFVKTWLVCVLRRGRIYFHYLKKSARRRERGAPASESRALLSSAYAVSARGEASAASCAHWGQRSPASSPASPLTFRLQRLVGYNFWKRQQLRHLAR
jgi:hypothetical protein